MKKRSPFGPWLLLPKPIEEEVEDNNNDKKELVTIRSFFSYSSNRVFHLELPHSRGQGHRCWGSPYGWLITLGIDLSIQIINPLTQSQLSLPPSPSFRESFPNAFLNEEDEEDFDDEFRAFLLREEAPERVCRINIYKIILGSNPSFWTSNRERISNQCCMLMYGEAGKLAFAFPGDQAWTTLETPSPRLGGDHEDAIFFNGKFYAVTRMGFLRLCDIDSAHPNGIDIASPPNCGDHYLGSMYLVEMSGDLHMVYRCLTSKADNEEELETSYFKVFKFDFNHRVWTTQLSDLGDHALFLGVNTSFSILACDCPELEANCVYFTDDCKQNYIDENDCDMGVYDYLKRVVKPFHYGQHVASTLTRPTLFLPSL